MYELFFYVGIVLCIACFVLSIFLFFSQNVIGAIKYFLKLDKKIMKNDRNNNNVSVPVLVQNNTLNNQNNVLNASLLNSTATKNNQNISKSDDKQSISDLSYEPTEVLDYSADMDIDEKTELLGVANFATALLDADRCDRWINLKIVKRKE